MIVSLFLITEHPQKSDDHLELGYERPHTSTIKYHYHYLACLKFVSKTGIIIPTMRGLNEIRDVNVIWDSTWNTVGTQ